MHAPFHMREVVYKEGMWQRRAGHEADPPGNKSSVRNIFIRGSVVRYVHLPAAAVDTALLEDATRRGESIFLF